MPRRLLTLFVVALLVLTALPASAREKYVAYHQDLLSPVTSPNYGEELGKLPPKIQEAVKTSQVQVVIALLTWVGPEIYSGNGLLIGERYALVPASMIPFYPDLAYGKSTVYAVNGIQAKFAYGSLQMNLAVLELSSPIQGMKAAEFIADIELNKKYEGLVLSDIRSGKSVAISFVPDSLAGGTFLPGEIPGDSASGSALWDENGKLAGVLEAELPETAHIIGFEAIKEFLERFKAWKESRSQENRSGENEGNGGQENSPSVRNRFPGLTLEDAKVVIGQSAVFAEILYSYATKSLNKPENLLACAQEMLRIKANEKSCRDKWSVYMPREVYEEGLAIDQRGKFGGVGIEVGVRDDKVVVISPMDGGPAYRAGVRPGDVILEVGEGDGATKPVQDISDAVRRIRGKVGTKVKIVFGRGEERKALIIVREEITIHAVEKKILPGNIGYLKVKTFSAVMPGEFKAALADFRAKGANKVILDFRYNPGGLMWEAIEVLYEFAKPGDTLMVMRERNRETVFDTTYVKRVLSENSDTFGNREPGTFRDMKVVVLINKGSASASEIFAGTMKDFGYPIVGSRSFGKGVGQTVFPLSDGSELKLTTFEFYVGNARKKVNEAGIEPTHPVNDPEPSSAEVLREDKQLEKAIEILNSQ